MESSSSNTESIKRKVVDSSEPVLDISVHVAVEGSQKASCGDDSAAPTSCDGGDSGDSRKRLGVGNGKRGCYIKKDRILGPWKINELMKMDMHGGNMDKRRFLIPSSQEITLDAHTG
ncbi:unnamed protein product [Eruca vesicaria subsp. sativa]|uniref:Uncharacterized protein n=1 Tax=Eruca vesicaria subsp. sativa TaxID=29727 RepID=A0ABC8K7H7_ERUVS|nr:unnamed protein product [Eruca vesicaria subsp. sativa]